MADVRNINFFANLQATVYKELQVFGERSLAQRTINGEARGYLKDWNESALNRAYFERGTLAASGGTKTWDLGTGNMQDVWGDEEVWTYVDYVLVCNHSKDPLGGEADQSTGENVSLTLSGTLIDAMLGITTGNRPYIWGDRGIFAFATQHTISGGADQITLTNNHGSLLGYYDLLLAGRGA